HSTKHPSGDPTPLRVPTVLWQEVTVDLVVGLLEDKGFTEICSVIDWFSKELVMFLVMTGCTVLELTQGFHDHIWKRHGMLVSILSDRGPQITSSFMAAVCKLLSIKQILMLPYHLQSDGQTEHMQQTWEWYLRAYVAEDRA